MFVRDNEVSIEVTTDKELDQFLTRRYEMDGVSVNSFWLTHVQEWPALSILIRDELACLDFMDDGIAFTSQGEMTQLERNGMMEFKFESQRQPVPYSHIVSVAEAVRAAKEFLHTGDQPACIRWLKL